MQLAGRLLACSLLERCSHDMQRLMRLPACCLRGGCSQAACGCFADALLPCSTPSTWVYDTMY